MGLEAPLALLGLLGVIVPLLVHRMRKRELPHVVLPTFALLSRAVAKSQQKQAFTDLWLLLARIALIALAALALTVPYFESRLSFGDGQLANVVVVIDDSLSMSRVDGSVSLIERARARAIEVVRSLPEGSELAVVLAGKPARVLVPMGRDLVNAQRILAEAPLRAVRSNDLTQALELALREQNRGLIALQRVLVLSDLARHASVDAKSLAPQPEISFERLGSPPDKPNLFVSSAQASLDPAHPAQTAIAVEVGASFGGVPPRQVDARVEVELNGKVVQSQAVTLEHAAAQATLRVPTPQPTQTVEAHIRIVGDDALAADNQVSVVLGHADALQLLLVNGDPHPATRSDELFYAGRALALLSEGQLAMRIKTVDPLSFEHARLGDSDVIVLANAAAPGPTLAQRIIEFVRDGGGLIITAGSRIDPAQYNARLDAVLPGHLRGAANCDDLLLTAADDPGFLPEGLAGLREVRSQQRLLLDVRPGADTLLQFADGAPALTARSAGDGRVLLLSVTLDTDYGDLPLRPGYLPLLAAMIRDAAGATAAARGRISPGQSVTLPSPRAGHFVEIRGPSGRRWHFSSTSAGERIQFTDTDALGMFEVRAGREQDPGNTRLRATFVVDPPREESDLTPGPVPELSAQGAASDTPPPRVTIHVPFSQWLWPLVFGLALLEGLLRARRRWDERSRLTGA